MSVRTNEEILEILRARMGDDISTDENISVLEDVSDTLNHLSDLADGQEDWKKKFETNDAEWRKKYTDRFFSTSVEEVEKEEVVENNDSTDAPTTFEELFKEEE